MKRNQKFLFAGVLLSAGAMALSTYGQEYGLTSGTTVAVVDVGSSAGMKQWSLGSENQLSQQWFWYRIGSGPQSSIDSISAAEVSRPGGDSTLKAAYNNANVNIAVSYTLLDQGLYQAAIDETIKIRNNTANPMSLTFYQYSDFNLNGTPLGDVAYTYGQGAYQLKGETGISEGLVSPQSDHFEANTAGGVSSTLYKLQNVPNLDLNGADYAEGDVTWAFQWDLNIDPGQTIDIVKTKWVWSATVPEPSSFSLIVLGLGALRLARRRK